MAAGALPISCLCQWQQIKWRLPQSNMPLRTGATALLLCTPHHKRLDIRAQKLLGIIKKKGPYYFYGPQKKQALACRGLNLTKACADAIGKFFVEAIPAQLLHSPPAVQTAGALLHILGVYGDAQARLLAAEEVLQRLSNLPGVEVRGRAFKESPRSWQAGR